MKLNNEKILWGKCRLVIKIFSILVIKQLEFTGKFGFFDMYWVFSDIIVGLIFKAKEKGQKYEISQVLDRTD